mmetsp:Transcript_2951/g.9712  ORF Transcript_2951/g.9712 Transcript_2951/m.9712 type:complete len:206 (-) Transcript_2951:276-893(-)
MPDVMRWSRESISRVALSSRGAEHVRIPRRPRSKCSFRCPGAKRRCRERSAPQEDRMRSSRKKGVPPASFHAASARLSPPLRLLEPVRIASAVREVNVARYPIRVSRSMCASCVRFRRPFLRRAARRRRPARWGGAELFAAPSQRSSRGTVELKAAGRRPCRWSWYTRGWARKDSSRSSIARIVGYARRASARRPAAADSALRQV